MSRITEYTSVSAFDENDVLIKDGENGTKIISVEDAAAEFRRLCGINGDISDINDSLSAFGANLAGVETTFIATKNYNIGDLFVIDGVLYRATATIASDSEINPETNCEETSFSTVIEAMNDILAGKANVDGAYDNLIAGNAKQLVGTVFTEDDAAYTFRTAGGSADIGDREYDEIVGGSIVWNQMAPAIDSWGVNQPQGTGSLTDDGFVFQVTSGNTGIVASNTYGSVKKDHIYFKTFEFKPLDEFPSNCFIYWPAHNQTTVNIFISGTAVGSWGTARVISKASDNKNYYQMAISLGSNGSTTDHLNKQIVVRKPQVFDLTQMFGSEIADYIYSLETATAGAGVAWFRKYFPKTYYEYNAGELMHVSDLQSHDMVGFNAWDEDYALGFWNNNGEFSQSQQGYLSNKTHIPVIPGEQYFITIGKQISFYIAFYDADKNFISRTNNAYVLSRRVFTTPSNCYYICFSTYDTYGMTYLNDICINLSWDGERDGEYEPYVKHSYPLDSSLTLRGIPKLSTDGKLYYDGDHYKSDGTVERRYGTYTFTGDESVNEVSYANGFDQSVTSVGYYVSIPNLQNTKKALLVNNAGYELGTEAPINYRSAIEWSHKDKTVVNILNSTTNGIMFRNDTIGSVELFKADIAGKTIVYELAEPTTEEADPYQSPQIVDDFGTEEYVTTSIVPVGHITQYDSNLRAKLEMAPNSPDGDGDYLVRQTSGQNEYVPYTDSGRITALEGKIPSAPSTDGAYVLKCTVADGTPTYSWVSA